MVAAVSNIEENKSICHANFGNRSTQGEITGRNINGLVENSIERKRGIITWGHLIYVPSFWCDLSRKSYVTALRRGGATFSGPMFHCGWHRTCVAVCVVGAAKR